MEREKKYKHIIWDWNGTLFDDAWLCVEIMQNMLKKRDMPGITLKKYQELFNFPVIDYYRRLGFDFNVESFQQLGTEYIDAYEERKTECNLQKYTIDVLDSVFSSGIKQSVLSAYKNDTLQELINHFDLKHYFTKVMGLDNHYAESKIDNGKALIRDLNLAGSSVLFVGDTVHDYEVASSISVDCILIPSGHQLKEKLERCGVKVVDSVRDVLNII